MTLISAVFAAGCSMIGAVTFGARGTIYGMALGVWVGAVVYWLEFRKAWQEAKRVRAVRDDHASAGAGDAPGGGADR